LGKELIKVAVFVNGLRILSELPGVAVSFDIDNPRAVAWIKRKVFKFSYEVNDTTIRKLRDVLVEALNAGETIREIAARVEELFGHAERYRNEMIARTETISATNYRAYEAIKQSGLMAKKEWISTIDERTRDSHTEMDGETAGLDEPFSNGLQFPGDPDGPAEEVINCRCTIGHIFPEDEEWNS